MVRGSRALKKHRQRHYMAVLYNNFPRDSFWQWLLNACEECYTQGHEPSGAPRAWQVDPTHRFDGSASQVVPEKWAHGPAIDGSRSFWS